MASLLTIPSKPSEALEQAATYLVKYEDLPEFIHFVRLDKAASNGNFSILNTALLFAKKKVKIAPLRIIPFSSFKLKGLAAFEKGLIHLGLINFGIRLIAIFRDQRLFDIIPTEIEVPPYPLYYQDNRKDFYSELKKVYLTLKQKSL